MRPLLLAVLHCPYRASQTEALTASILSELAGIFIFQCDDHTQDIALYANYCLVKNKVSFDAFWVPIEHFTMSHELKTERHVFTLHYYDRYGHGDLHLNTNIQPLTTKQKKYNQHCASGTVFLLQKLVLQDLPMPQDIILMFLSLKDSIRIRR